MEIDLDNSTVEGNDCGDIAGSENINDQVKTSHDISMRAMWHTNCLASRFGGPMKPIKNGWKCVSCGAESK